MIAAGAVVLLGLGAADPVSSRALVSPHQREVAASELFSMIRSPTIAFQPSNPVIKVAQSDDPPTASDANEYLSKLFNAGTNRNRIRWIMEYIPNPARGAIAPQLV